MFAPGVVGRQFELRSEPLMQDMERRDDAVEDMNPDAVVPHIVETLFQRGRAHDLPPGHGLVEIAGDGGRLGDKAAVSDLEGWSFAPGVHLQMAPLPLLADGRHVVDVLFELIGNALFVHEDAQALGVREGRRRGEEFEFRCHDGGSLRLKRIVSLAILPDVR
jgi:hypothetical protein